MRETMTFIISAQNDIKKGKNTSLKFWLMFLPDFLFKNIWGLWVIPTGVSNFDTIFLENLLTSVSLLTFPPYLFFQVFQS